MATLVSPANKQWLSRKSAADPVPSLVESLAKKHSSCVVTLSQLEPYQFEDFLFDSLDAASKVIILLISVYAMEIIVEIIIRLWFKFIYFIYTSIEWEKKHLLIEGSSGYVSAFDFLLFDL